MGASFQDLRVWQQAMMLAGSVYRATESFPKHELFGLVSQMRRAAVSVASNIAEGKGHRSDREFVHFLYHARGSMFELETQILLARQIQLLPEDKAKELMESVTSVGRSLTGLINSLDHAASAATS